MGKIAPPPTIPYKLTFAVIGVGPASVVKTKELNTSLSTDVSCTA